MTLSFETISSVLAFLLAVASILTLAVKEGERRAGATQMKADIDKAGMRISTLEKSSQHMEVILALMQKDIGYIKAAADEIKTTLAKHCEET